MLRMTFFCIGLITFSSTAIAGLYPIVSNLTITINSPTSATYHFQQELVEMGSATERVLSTGYYVGLDHRHNSPNGPIVTLYQNVQTLQGETLGEAALRAYKKTGSITVMPHNGSENGGECVGYFALKGTNRGPFSSAIYPPGACVYAPPGNDWCRIITPNLTIDHGTIRISTGSVNTKDELIDIECTAPMNVSIKFGNDVLKLANSVQSNLSVVGGSEKSLPAGNSNVTLRSTLSVGSDASPGLHQDSTVVFIDYH